MKPRRRGSRTEDDNVISEGSVIVVNEGQCMMIVDQGKIVDFCAEPGEYIYKMGGEFSGEKIKTILKTTFDRLSFGGQADRRARISAFTASIPMN